MFMILHYSYCNVSVLPLYKDPSHRSEQVSQLLFGEKVEVIFSDDKGWAQIRAKWDEYEGWCRISQLSILSKKEYVKDIRYMVMRNNDKILLNYAEIWVPAGGEFGENKFAVEK